MAGSRDEFPAPIVREIAQRGGFHCSLCKALTVGPDGAEDGSISVGVASHIKAAARGGPRFDPDQSPEERKSINNGLWTCSNCARIVDRDPITFTVEQLLRIRAEHERWTRTRLGRTPATADDQSPDLRDEVESTMLGFFDEARLFEATYPWTGTVPPSPSQIARTNRYTEALITFETRLRRIERLFPFLKGTLGWQDLARAVTHLGQAARTEGISADSREKEWENCRFSLGRLLGRVVSGQTVRDIAEDVRQAIDRVVVLSSREHPLQVSGDIINTHPSGKMTCPPKTGPFEK